MHGPSRRSEGVSTDRRLRAAWARLLAGCAAAALLGGCAGEVAAQRHLEFASAIHALDVRPQLKLRDTPECRAADPGARSSGAVRASPSIRTADGRLAFLSAAQAASLQRAAVDSYAAAVLLPGGEQDATRAWPHPIPALRPGTARLPQGSVLVTRRDVPVRVSDLQWSGWRMSLLTHHAPAQDALLLAAVVRRQALGPSEQVFIWFAQGPGSDSRAALMNLSALEHLYSLAYAQEPAGPFRFIVAGEADVPGDAEHLSHSGLLLRIALARQCVASVVARQGDVKPVPWRSISIRPAPQAADPSHPYDVSARLHTAAGTMADVNLVFTRLPHFECSARSGADGVAACRLVDVMGHDGHPGFESAPTVVTFPGDVKPDLILLPTTLLVRR